MRRLAVAITLGALAFACRSRETGGTVPVDTKTVSAANASKSTVADADLQFIDTMIAHHDMALPLAEEVSKRGSAAEIKELAGNVLIDHRRDIARLRRWRELWYRGVPSMVVSHLPAGSQENATVDHLRTLDGAQLDAMFVDMLIEHHSELTTLARETLRTSQRSEIREYAQQMINRTESEIAQLNTWKTSMKMPADRQGRLYDFENEQNLRAFHAPA